MAKRYDDRDHWEEEIDMLVAQDFKVMQFNDYHFRINDRLDVWPSRRRWYDLKSKQKGFYTSIVELAHGMMGYRPLLEYSGVIPSRDTA